jgi:very-short-patch-repair endonuclease
MKGFQFRRQRPVLNFIADFMCKELMLTIEVDGITHTHPKVIEQDRIKQLQLEQAGFTVLRFTDDEVLTHIKGSTGSYQSGLANREFHPLTPASGGKKSENTISPSRCFGHNSRA